MLACVGEAPFDLSGNRRDKRDFFAWQLDELPDINLNAGAASSAARICRLNLFRDVGCAAIIVFCIKNAMIYDKK